MRRVSGQGEVHHDPSVPTPLHLQGLSAAASQVSQRHPDLSNLPEIDPPDDQSLLVRPLSAAAAVVCVRRQDLTESCFKARFFYSRHFLE